MPSGSSRCGAICRHCSTGLWHDVVCTARTFRAGLRSRGRGCRFCGARLRALRGAARTLGARSRTPGARGTGDPHDGPAREGGRRAMGSAGASDAAHSRRAALRAIAVAHRSRRPGVLLSGDEHGRADGLARGGGTPRGRETALRLSFSRSRARRIARRAGRIPVGGRVARFARDRVLLVGDAAGIVSPLTAGGIHTALESGWRAAHAIADYLYADGPEPARAAAAAYPRFVMKRALRAVADLPLPNWLFDALLGSAALRLVANSIYFHRRGDAALSAATSSEEDELRRPAE